MKYHTTPGEVLGVWVHFYVKEKLMGRQFPTFCACCTLYRAMLSIAITATPLFCWLMALIVSACGGVGKKWWFINHLFNHSSQFSGGIEQPVNNIIIVWINL